MTELCDGRTLRDLVLSEDDDYNEREVLNQIVSGVDYLHTMNIILEFIIDLKPDNILCSQFDETNELVMKIADFGCSRIIKMGDQSHLGGLRIGRSCVYHLFHFFSPLFHPLLLRSCPDDAVWKDN